MPTARWFATALLVWVATLSGSANAQVSATVNAAPQTKIALLIGNWDYDEDKKFTEPTATPQERLTDLSNPCNDVELIEGKLIQLKWEPSNIFIVCNGHKKDILDKIEDFSQKYMESPQPFGFIYYAGHGVQIDKDAYIFGVDTKVNISRVVDMYNRHGPRANLFKGGVKITREILSTIGDPGRGSVLVVLDACREDPLYAALARQGISSSGPSKQSAIAARGIKIFYSTAEGELAPDGARNSNSDFAAVFANQMIALPTVDHLLRTVADEIYQKTKFSPRPQVPDEAGSLNRPPPEVCFKECNQ